MLGNLLSSLRAIRLKESMRFGSWLFFEFWHHRARKFLRYENVFEESRSTRGIAKYYSSRETSLENLGPYFVIAFLLNQQNSLKPVLRSNSSKDGFWESIRCNVKYEIMYVLYSIHFHSWRLQIRISKQKSKHISLILRNIFSSRSHYANLKLVMNRLESLLYEMLMESLCILSKLVLQLKSAI